MRRQILKSIALAGFTLAPLTAHATGTGEVAVTGKGIVGGTLLGAELVTVSEAAFKVQPAWAYIVGGVAGGAAGGVGGYFVEKNGSAKTNMFMLAGGMAFVIPTIVAVLSATSYEPPANYLQDRPPADEPVAEPPGAPAMPAPTAPTLTPGGTEVTPPPPAPAAAPPAAAPPAAPPAAAPAPAAPAPATPTPTGSLPRKHSAGRLPPYHLTPPALIAFTPDALSLNVPAVEVGGRYTREELALFGVAQATEVRVPVLNFVF
ncbi:MAG TPA: hypothetical protein VGM29_14330 [Polyangiaceae bacterium]|jgi:hypothetical protein